MNNVTLTEQITFYDSKYKEDAFHEAGSYYDWIAGLALKHGGTRVLDVACGSGLELAALQRKEASPHGVDISTVGLAAALKNCPSASVAQSSADALPFQSGSFDAVTCLGSLEHFIRQDEALKEVHRVLKPGGIFVATLPNSRNIVDIAKRFLYGSQQSHGQILERFYTRREGKELIERSGLRVIKTLGYNSPGTLRGSPVWNYLIKPLIPTELAYHICFVCKKPNS